MQQWAFMQIAEDRFEGVLFSLHDAMLVSVTSFALNADGVRKFTMPYKIYGERNLFASFGEAKDVLLNQIALDKGVQFQNYYEDYEQALIDQIVDEMSETQLWREFEPTYDANHELHARFSLMIRRYPAEYGSTKYAVWNYIHRNTIRALAELDREYEYKMSALRAEQDEDWFRTLQYLQEHQDEKDWDPINFLPPSEHEPDDEFSDEDDYFQAKSERYGESLVSSLDLSDCTDCKDYEDRDDFLYYRSLILNYERELGCDAATIEFMHKNAGTLHHVFGEGYFIYDEVGSEVSAFAEEDEFNRLIEKFRHRQFMHKELEEFFGIKLDFGLNNTLVINGAAIEGVSWGLPVNASEQQQQSEKLKLTIEAYLSKRSDL